jgi:hypothetical protein
MRIPCVLALAALGLLWVVPSALGAPANDDFANAQAIGSLPVSLAESNVGATKEEGEPYHGSLGSKGHSVWFKWEAPSSGFVTVDTCGSELATALSVYTGTKVDGLSKVGGDFSSEGPRCPHFDGHAITFEAITGVTYEIAVDGDAFYLPPAEPPVGEGGFQLQVEVTPTPANDDFAASQPIDGSVDEEEGAEFASYWASVNGFNWNASKETGEPEHAGNPGGASVWYSWTAPETGVAHLSMCCGSWLLGLYAGSSVDGLTGIAPILGSPPGSFPVNAGATYRIAVDGPLAGTPTMGSFDLSIFMSFPQRPKRSPASTASTSPLPVADTTPPNTTIRKFALRRKPPILSFHFESTEPGSTFQCKLDRQLYRKCGSGKRYKHLAPGRHTLEAFAIDSAGNADPSPAVTRFTFPAGPKSKSHR